MPTAREAMRGLIILATLLAMSLILSSCDLVVEEPKVSTSKDYQQLASTSATELPLYDVMVSAIDFDPPLKQEALLGFNKPIKLLAAIENKGTMTLTELTIEASVSSQKGDFNARDRVPLAKLAPGETRVVEFGGMVPTTPIPKSPSYRIRVTVDGRQLGPNVHGNVREVIVRVADAPLAE